jgi:sugar phosphate isomerase/epimerase
MSQFHNLQKGNSPGTEFCGYQSSSRAIALLSNPAHRQEFRISATRFRDQSQLHSTPLGVSTNLLPKLSLKEAVHCLDQYKFKDIELQLEYKARFDYTSREVEQFLKECQLNLGMDFTVHSPYIRTDLAAEDESFRRSSVLEVLSSIVFAAELGARCITVHTGGYGERSLDQLLRSLDVLVEQAQKYEISICLENTGAECPEWLLLSDEECVEVCYKTGCFLTIDLVHIFSLNSDPFAALDWLLPFACNCHLADTRDRQHLHLPVGQGNLPIHEILSVLDRSSYSGKVIVDEIEHMHTAQEYLEGAAAFRDSLATQ